MVVHVPSPLPSNYVDIQVTYKAAAFNTNAIEDANSPVACLSGKIVRLRAMGDDVTILAGSWPELLDGGRTNPERLRQEEGLVLKDGVLSEEFALHHGDAFITVVSRGNAVLRIFYVS